MRHHPKKIDISPVTYFHFNFCSTFYLYATSSLPIYKLHMLIAHNSPLGLFMWKSEKRWTVVDSRMFGARLLAFSYFGALWDTLPWFFHPKFTPWNDLMCVPILTCKWIYLLPVLIIDGLSHILLTKYQSHRLALDWTECCRTDQYQW